MGKVALIEEDSNTAINFDDDNFFYAESIKISVFDTNKTKTLEEKATELGFEDVPDIDFDKLYEVREGAFWGWINLSGVDLSCYQIFDELKAENYKDNCFVWACKQSNLFTETDIEALISIMKTRLIPLKKIKEIAEAFEIKIKIAVPYEDSKTKYIEYGKEYKDKQLDLLLMNNNFMLNKPVTVSTCYLKNKKYIDKRYADLDLEKRCQIRELHKDGSIHKHWPEDHTFPLLTVLKTMFEKNLFRPIRNMEQINGLGCEYQNKLQDYWYLNYSEKVCTREITKEIKPKAFDNIYFADFETDPTTNPHTPYLFITTFDKSFVAIDCECKDYSNKIFDLYPDNSLIYFHNLKYDICFLINTSKAQDVKIIKRTGTVIQVTLKYKKKKLTFRDSLCIIPAKLASFGEMFNLKVHKEVMAYKLYTKANRDRRVIPIQEY
jgi:hypothetical protein